jgi:hypothetical protein
MAVFLYVLISVNTVSLFSTVLFAALFLVVLMRSMPSLEAVR